MNSLGVQIAFVILALALSAALLAWVATKLLGRGKDAAVDLINTISGSLGFRPKVFIDSRAYLEGSYPILELATTQMTFTKTHLQKFEGKWTNLWNTKEVQLLATYTVKAGFDLKNGVSLNFDRRNKLVTVALPDAQILSFERREFKLLHADGRWTDPSAEQVAEVEATMERMAREEVTKSTILPDAKSGIENRIRAAIPLSSEVGLQLISQRSAQFEQIFLPSTGSRVH